MPPTQFLREGSARSTLTRFAILQVLFSMALQPMAAIAQSGRTRPRVAPPPTKAPAAAPVNIPANAVVVKQEQVGNVSRFTLRNGMTVIVDELHATPIVASAAYFRTTASSTADSTRLASVLQRVVLRGKTTGKTNAVAEMRVIGGLIDGETDSGGSLYRFVAPSNMLKEALAIQSDLLQNAVIDSEGASAENWRYSAQTNLSLSRLRANDRHYGAPDDELTASVIDAAWDTNTNPSPVALEQLTELYRSTYRPDNMVLILSGDVVPYNALIEVQLAYAGFGARRAAPPPRVEPRARAGAPGSTAVQSASSPTPVSKQTTPKPAPVSQQPTSPVPAPAPQQPTSIVPVPPLRYRAERLGTSQPLVAVSFQVPGLNSADWSALEILAGLMGRGYGSRLGRTLVDGRVAARVEVDYCFSTHSGRFVVRMWPSAEARASSFDRAESALFRELDRIRRELPGELELVRAKAMVEQRFVDRTGSYVARASMLARFEGSTAGLRGALDYRNFIRSVRAEDVQRAAAKHLMLQAASVIELQPSSEPQRQFDSERFAATVAAWAPGLAATVDPSSVRAAEATETAPAQQRTEKSEQQLLIAQSTEPLPVKDFSTLRGPRAFVREDHSSPLITVAVLFHGGRIVEESNNSGITELMLRSMLYGTARRSYLQITDELEQLGARVEVVVEPDFFGLLCTVLSRNAERIPRILRDIIEEPAFREADLKLAALRQLGAIRSERDSGEARARELLFASLFAGHPYSLPAHGREEVVAALTTEQLRDWHLRSIKRQLPLIAIVGDTEGSALVGGQLAEGFRRNDLDSSLKVRIPGTAAATEKADQVSRPASAMSMGSQIPKADQVDPIPLELLADALNGPGGRLEAELMNKQSIAFDTSFDYLIMFSAGALWIDATLPPDKEGQGRAAFQTEFQRLARDGLTEKEVAGAQASAAGVRLLTLQSQPRRAIAYVRNAVYQRPAADVDSYEERVSRFTVDNLKRVSSQYFKTASIGIARGAN